MVLLRGTLVLGGSSEIEGLAGERLLRSLEDAQWLSKVAVTGRRPGSVCKRVNDRLRTVKGIAKELYEHHSPEDWTGSRKKLLGQVDQMLRKLGTLRAILDDDADGPSLFD